MAERGEPEKKKKKMALKGPLSQYDDYLAIRPALPLIDSLNEKAE